MKVKFRGKTLNIDNLSKKSNEFYAEWNYYTIEIFPKYYVCVTSPLGSCIVDGHEESTMSKCLQVAFDNIDLDLTEMENVVSEKNQLQDYSKQKKRNKRERDKKYKEHMKRLNKISRGYPSHVRYIDEIYVGGYGYIENTKPYYKRLYRGKRSKYLKKQSHRKIRRYKGGLHNGWQCHKLYDFWWEYC